VKEIETWESIIGELLESVSIHVGMVINVYVLQDRRFWNRLKFSISFRFLIRLEGQILFA
jgi:hypothetical protein